MMMLGFTDDVYMQILPWLSQSSLREEGSALLAALLL
jgi:hypothetical protein